MRWQRVMFWVGLPVRFVLLAVVFLFLLLVEGKNVVNWREGLFHSMDKAIRTD